MNRRDTLAALFALGAMGGPLGSVAQQPGKVWRIGFLYARSRDVYLDAFLQGMRELGYIEGKNLVIEWRIANGQFDRLPGFAAELAQMKVDVIVTHALPPTLAVQRATSTIPIVFTAMVDPIGSGVVKNLARPEGNVTGLSLMSADVAPKQVELLASIIPRLSRIALLTNPINPIHPAMLRSMQAAAQLIGARVLPVDAKNPEDIEPGFLTMAGWNAEAVIVPPDAFFVGQRLQIAQAALKKRIPTMFQYREDVESGGLLSYGQNLADFFRRSASYVDKILKGSKTSDLPIEQPTIFELVINLKTAKVLGIKIPQSVLVRADRVIE